MKPTGTRVIYPELPDSLSLGDLLQLFRPSFDERQWAPTIARTSSSWAAFLVQLKIFQTPGRFRHAADVPIVTIEYVAAGMWGWNRFNAEFSQTRILSAVWPSSNDQQHPSCRSGLFEPRCNSKLKRFGEYPTELKFKAKPTLTTLTI